MKSYVFWSTHECTIKTGPKENRRIAAFNNNFFAVTEKNAATYGITAEEWRDELLATINAKNRQIKLTAGTDVEQTEETKQFDAEADEKAAKRKPTIQRGARAR